MRIPAYNEENSFRALQVARYVRHVSDWIGMGRDG
ncbi:unnamed protein product, partial [Rotaria socialis]